MLRVVVAVLTAAAAAYVAHLASPINPIPYQLPPLPLFDGSWASNRELAKVEKLYQGVLTGPESFAVDGDGRLYISVADGRIIRSIEAWRTPAQGAPPPQLQTFAHVGNRTEGCGTYEAEPECGRPLGMAFDADGNLIVCDGAGGGLLSVDKEGQVRVLATHSADGRRVAFCNTVRVASDGRIYFVDSSSRFSRRDFMYLMLEHSPLGRLLRYDPISGTVEELVGDLVFPNGLELSQDESQVLISETSRARIVRFTLSPPHLDVFIENLPGIPDNLCADRSGGVVWIGFATKRVAPVALMDMIGPYPFVRTLVAKLFSQDVIRSLVPRYGLIAAVDAASGTVVKTLHDPRGRVTYISEVHPMPDGSLLLGSFRNDYLGLYRP